MEAGVARAVISDPKRRAAYEPLYDIDPQTGASVEVFYADQVLAESFGTRGAGWF
jgi:ABC-type ATPase involved in cell division